jgi:hypothetical protein
MWLRAGQAARYTARHCGRIAHVFVHTALLLLLFAGAGFALAAWRLAQGPVEVRWLIPQLEAIANRGSSTHLAIGGAALAWEGFRHGAAGSLDIRVSDVTLTGPDGRHVVAVPHAAVSLASGPLVHGHLVLRTLVVEGARLRATRSEDGTLSIDFGDLPEVAKPVLGSPQAGGPGGGLDARSLLRTLAAPPGGPRATSSAWAQLRHVLIERASVVVIDRHLHVAWRISTADLDLRRGAAGGVEATATATLAIGGASTSLDLHATVERDGAGALVTGRLGPVAPAALVTVLPQAAALAAPVTVTGAARMDRHLDFSAFTADTEIGAGTLHLGEGTAPLLEAHVTFEGTPARLDVPLLRLVTAPRPDGPRSTFTGEASAWRDDAGASAILKLGLDHVAFADLPVLWPAGVGGKGTRPWIVQNITGGLAHDGHVEVGFAARPDLSEMQVTHVGGGIDGSDLEVHWLRPVPPILHGEARLNLLTPDSVEVIAHSGTQYPGAGGAIAIRGGRAVFTNFSDPDQFADITADLAGQVKAAFSLIGNPKIGLLQKSPLKVGDVAGSFAGRIGITHMNLRDDMKLDDLQIATSLKLASVRLPKIAAGQDLTDGNFDLSADSAGLHMAGPATVAGIPVQLIAGMDFRGGPPSQVLQRVSLSGTTNDTQRAALGMDLHDILSGPLPATAQVAIRRDQRGEAAISADLGPATLRIDPLDYAKPAGEAAKLSARLLLDHDRITGIDGVSAEGVSLRAVGAASFADGRPASVTITRLALGRLPDAATDVSGSLRLPARPGDPYVVNLTGRSLDASSQLKRQPTPPGAKPKPPQPGPPYRLQARFDRIIVGPDRAVDGVTVQADSDGQIMRRLDLAGRTPAGSPFTLAIASAPPGRTLRAATDDAGGLLRALNVLDNIHGGKLTLAGSYDDTSAGHPLNGNVEIDNFRVRNAPFIIKLLQAMSLYGLLDTARGSGLGFSKLVAPFRLTNDVLDLGDSRVFSSSLGMTARGQVDLAHETMDLHGTVVPAYFFNSLLGKVPLVGRLFSPEPGSGLFAATYHASGPFADPAVGVNPLAALTPGFLRGVFGLFDSTSAPPPPSSPPRSPAH